MQIRILVADDSASDRLIIKHMLKEFNILTARDGMETIQMLNEHDGINILILDLNNNTHNHICIIQDITERKQIELERKYINEHQRLTGLYNCDYFEVFFADDIKQRKSLKRALVGINLSNIQSVTVNYGLIYTHDLIKR